jgi:hypothetical protein
VLLLCCTLRSLPLLLALLMPRAVLHILGWSPLLLLLVVVVVRLLLLSS